MRTVGKALSSDITILRLIPVFIVIIINYIAIDNSCNEVWLTSVNVGSTTDGDAS
jgi:hypothetical protein